MKKILFIILILGFTPITIFAQKLTLTEIENENGELTQCYKDENGEVLYTVFYIGSIADNYSGGLSQTAVITWTWTLLLRTGRHGR